MPFEIQYERDGIGVVVTASGTVMPKDIYETFDRVWKRPDSSRLRYHIIHILDGTSFTPALAELRQIGMLIPETLKYSPGVCTVLVTHSVAMMGTLSIASAFGRALAKGPRLHLCWSMDEAKEWVRKECPDLDLIK